jgi:hypothetical protein
MLQTVLDLLNIMVPDIKDVHNKTVIRSHILQYLEVLGSDGRPRAPLVSHCQTLWAHHQVMSSCASTFMSAHKSGQVRMPAMVIE